MRIPATLELRGSWTVVIDPKVIEPTGVYVLAVAGEQHEHLFIDGRYMGLVIGSMPTIEHEHEYSGYRHHFVTARTVNMMLHTHQDDDPRNEP